MISALKTIFNIKLGKIYNWFNEIIKQVVPEKLMSRSMIIFIGPVLLLQLLTVFVFLQNERDKISEKLSVELVRELALLVAIFENNPPQRYDQLVDIVSKSLDVEISYTKESKLGKTSYIPFFDVLESNLNNIIKSKIKAPYFVNAGGREGWVEVGIVLDNGYTIRVNGQQSRTDLTTTFAFASVIFLASFLILSITILLMRNQIRPIERLSQAMHEFGRGQKSLVDFQVRGSKEIQQSGRAFLRMKHRIERQWEERRNFLAGISHDLRTMITRFKLQISLLEKNKATRALKKDLDEMQKMVESYLSFMREDIDEDTKRTNMKKFIEEIISKFAQSNRKIKFEVKSNKIVNIRPTAMKRAIVNILTNATRHADLILVELGCDGRYVNLVVHDDGPGIDDKYKEEVFKPFFRLDEARNLDYSGSGLGLSITKDAILSHGGQIFLRDSTQLGGLSVDIRFPV